MSAIETSVVQNAQNAHSSTETSKTGKKSGSYGKTIGEPKLSERGQKYYEELKKKYSNMDFILVSKDQKANAQANAGSYANPKKTVVLIDEEKIEKMASDENYRKQYEGIISNAGKNLSSLKSQIESTGQKVKGYGMQVNDDGTTSFFAVLKKSSTDQRSRIEKRTAEKKEAKRAEEKKTRKKAQEEKLQKARSEKADKTVDDDDYVTIKANSVEELMKKIGDYSFAQKSDAVMTDAEKMVGENIDFRG